MREIFENTYYFTAESMLTGRYWSFSTRVNMANTKTLGRGGNSDAWHGQSSGELTPKAVRAIIHLILG